MIKNEGGLVVNYRNMRLINIGLDVGFLVIHSLLLIFFLHYGIRPMYIFNIFSVVLYIFLPILLLREQYSLFVQIMHLEVVIHMTLAIYYVGWDSGFQIAMLGFNIYLVYAEYIARTLKLKQVHSLVLCLISMFLYIGSEVVDYHHVPQYLMPPEMAYRLRVGWAAIVFVITIFFLQLFAYLASGMQKQLAEEALHDKLTGMHNRYYMNDYLERRARRGGGWLAIADIDNFKQINDQYGHNCGDYVLKTVAELIQNIGADTEVCRWGGEEFLLVGDSKSDIDSAVRRLNDLRQRVSDYRFEYNGTVLNLTVTIGAASGQPNDSVEKWVNRADIKLYEGKTTGKNKVLVD